MPDSGRKPIAAIDIGTNSAHLVIAEMDSAAGMRVLDTDKIALRLGQAIDKHHNITADGMQRTVEAVKHMQELTNSYQASIRAVATHATRESYNYRELLDKIKNVTGIDVEVIDGVEEARLVFLGMRYGLPLNGKRCLGLDIGGGSTEMILACDDEISYVGSAKLGAVTLTAKYLDPENPKSKQIDDLTKHVRSRLAPYLPELRDIDFERAIACAGTAKALAQIHSQMFSGVSLSDPNGYIIRRDDLMQMHKQLVHLKSPKRIRNATGIDSSRAEIILAGTIILTEITQLLGVDEWTVTSYGLREGLVADTFFRMNEDLSSNPADVQWSSVRKFSARLGLSQTHGEQMIKLTSRLYLQLAPILRPEDDEHARAHDLKLLQVASYLHNAGKFISAPQYHKHSSYLISNSPLPGFTQSERQWMGLINQYQRKSIPSANSRTCAHLSPSELHRLKLLSGILRLAASLDRTRQNKVNDVTVKEFEGQLFFEIGYPNGIPDVEIHKARLEQSALERSFDRKVSMELKKKKKA